MKTIPNNTECFEILTEVLTPLEIRLALESATRTKLYNHGRFTDDRDFKPTAYFHNTQDEKGDKTFNNLYIIVQFKRKVR